MKWPALLLMIYLSPGCPGGSGGEKTTLWTGFGGDVYLGTDFLGTIGPEECIYDTRSVLEEVKICDDEGCVFPVMLSSIPGCRYTWTLGEISNSW